MIKDTSTGLYCHIFVLYDIGLEGFIGTSGCIWSSGPPQGLLLEPYATRDLNYHSVGAGFVGDRDRVCCYFFKNSPVLMEIGS